jgi:hypothetical protein
VAPACSATTIFKMTDFKPAQENMSSDIRLIFLKKINPRGNLFALTLVTTAPHALSNANNTLFRPSFAADGAISIQASFHQDYR